MKKRKALLCLFIFSAIVNKVSIAQGVPLATWRDHLPYMQTISVAVAPDKVYCAAKNSLFYRDLIDNTINRMSTITGLSDVELSTLSYNSTTDKLLIAYLNGNLDILKKNGEVINVSFIKKSDILGSKAIHRIDLEDEFAYLSCGFGIVIFDTKREEIKDTYFVGDTTNTYAVYDVLLKPDTIFAVTEKGLFKGPRIENLADYRNWIRDDAIPRNHFNLITELNDRIYINEKNKVVNVSDTVYRRTLGNWEKLGVAGDTADDNVNFDFLIDNGQLVIAQSYGFKLMDEDLQEIEKVFTYDGVVSPQPRQLQKRGEDYWVADNGVGLVRVPGNYRGEIMSINSPETDRVFDMNIVDGHLWYAAGAYVSNFNNLFYWAILGHFENERWNSVSSFNTPELLETKDMVSVAVDPNDPSHVFAGSWSGGLYELRNEKVEEVFDVNNLAEHSLTPRVIDTGIFVGGLAFDQFSNLWISNAYNSRALSVYTAEKEWKSFDLRGLIGDETAVAKVLADRNNNVWVLQHRDDKIIVYNHNGTPLDLSDDPEPAVIDNSEGTGNLPGDYLFCAVEDYNSEIWIGTNKGVAVIYNSSAIFNGGDYDAQQIFIQQDGTTQILFETESVTAIAVDGANRKWIGTQNAGAFLMSADGTQEIHHFSTDNSPLFSNFIRTIAIDDKTGEVYFGTDKGLISYRGSATGSEEKISKVTVFPNPVKPGYSGLIAINGLVENTVVKITDSNGGLVYETQSLGGQAVWDGKNFDGQRVATGVYLIFSAGNAGEETNVSKVMILN